MAVQISGGRTRLHARLVAGSAWLVQRHDDLLAMPDVGLGSPEERAFLDGLDLWCDLENILRAAYEYKGCALGEGAVCPAEAVATCETCADAVEV